MLALANAVTSIFTSVGTAAGISGAGAAAAGVGLVSTTISTLGSIQAANYQAAISQRAALIREENANRIVAAGRREAQLQDLEATTQIADDISAQAASGFSLSSRSFIRRRNRLTELAGQDREAIVEDSRVQAQSEREAAGALRAEARQYKRSALFSVLSGSLGIADSLIGGANLAGTVATRRTTNTARTIGF